MDTQAFEETISQIRSPDEDTRKLSIMQVPSLILQSLEKRDELLDQVLLMIYNLSTDSEPHDRLTLSNRTTIIRHLLRLYATTTQEHSEEQLGALVKLIDHANSSEMLVELANVLNDCDPEGTSTQEALETIRNKAAANLFPEALLMVDSIMAMR